MKDNIDLTKIDFSKHETRFYKKLQYLRYAERQQKHNSEIEKMYQVMFSQMKPRGIINKIIYKLFIKPAWIKC